MRSRFDEALIIERGEVVVSGPVQIIREKSRGGRVSWRGSLEIAEGLPNLGGTDHTLRVDGIDYHVRLDGIRSRVTGRPTVSFFGLSGVGPGAE